MHRKKTVTVSLVHLLLVVLHCNNLVPPIFVSAKGILPIRTRFRTFLAKLFGRQNQHSQSSTASNDDKEQDDSMGQAAMRMMTYDRAANERNAVSALTMAGKALQWHRLDDGVMGGQSETNQDVTADGILLFRGTINTNGGGFTSIRSPVPEQVLTSQTHGVKIRYKGDGKTYKFIIAQPGAGAPMARMPSWQADLPTTKSKDADDWNETVIPFDSLLPSWGGSSRSKPEQDKEKYTFDATEMKQMGLMLSLKLSNGIPNPPETFGEGVFSFELQVQSIEPVGKE